jgi:hypothetical protein
MRERIDLLALLAERLHLLVDGFELLLCLGFPALYLRHASAYVSIRQHTSAYSREGLLFSALLFTTLEKDFSSLLSSSLL